MRIRLVAWAVLILIGASPVAIAAEQDTVNRRRTPVVEVFETSKDAVVNISSTEIVQVRDPFDRLFEGFFDPSFRLRSRQYKRRNGDGRT